MPLSKELATNECKNLIRNLNGTVSAEVIQSSYCDYSSYFDRLSFQVQIEKNTNVLHCNQVNTVCTGVFTYKTNSYNWTAITANSKSRCK